MQFIYLLLFCAGALYIIGFLITFFLIIADYLAVSYCNRWQANDMRTITRKENLQKLGLLILNSWIGARFILNHMEQKTYKRISPKNQ